MAGIVNGLGSAVSAVVANSRFFNTTAGNIANLQTENYEAARTRFTSVETGGTTATSTIDPALATLAQEAGEGTPSDVDLGTEATNLTRGGAAYKAAIRVAQAGDELLEATIDIKR